MSGEKISQALGDISDAYLESAMDIYERKRRARKLWYRVAALAAVVALLLGMMLWGSGEDAPAPFFSVYAYAEGMGTVELCSNGEKNVFSTENELRYEELYDDYLDEVMPLYVESPSTAFAPDFFIQIAFEMDSHEFLLNWRSEYNFKVLVDGEVLMEGEDAYKRIKRGETKAIFEGEVFEGVLRLRSDNVNYQIAGAVEEPTELQFIVTTKYGAVIQQYNILVTPRGEDGLQEIELIYACVDGECVFKKDR